MTRVLVAAFVGVLLIIMAVVAANAAIDCRGWAAWPALEARARAQQFNATQAEISQFVALVQWNTNCRRKLAAIDRLISRVEARGRS